MLRSLMSGVAGLKAYQTKMDVIGNNIANVNTVGFKSSSVNFSDVFYQTTQSASASTQTKAGTNAKTTLNAQTIPAENMRGIRNTFAVRTFSGAMRFMILQTETIPIGTKALKISA